MRDGDGPVRRGSPFGVGDGRGTARVVDVGHGIRCDHVGRAARGDARVSTGRVGGGYEDWVASLHPGDRAACIERVEQALADPGPYVLLHRTIWPDGSVHSIECRGTVLVDDDGRPSGTTGVAIDVTMREQLVQIFQRTLLPASLPSVPGTSVGARYRSAERRNNIGGDWYAVVPLRRGHLGLAIGDVAGHGLEAVSTWPPPVTAFVPSRFANRTRTGFCTS